MMTAIFSAVALLASSCKEGKSYSDMLRDEKAAVNWYLCQQRVEEKVPADSVFEVGENAPFYRMNSDGSVYMRVLNQGDMNNRAKKGETVYFRFMAYSVTAMYQYDTIDVPGTGNSENMNNSFGNTSFVYGNTILPSTTQYGTGIQLPLNYLGYGCEVDLVVKSTEGFTSNTSECIPYLFKNLKYFKAEY